jgi:pyruvate,water dikinase
LLRQYILRPEKSPAVLLAAAEARRTSTVEEIESRLVAGKLDEFHRLVDAARRHVPISEERAFWQLSLIGLIRRPSIALGRKLVSSGVCEEPNDVFFMNFTELQRLSDAPSPQQVMIGERKRELAEQESLRPPPFIGTAVSPDSASGELKRFYRHYRGAGLTPAEAPNVIKGQPASKGVATGRARIILDLSEAGRLQQGDVLVCQTMAPPWTPLFAIAAAVVTDSGGILSHGAICAREYGIPCVAGTQVGTSRIPEGALVTVDGERGTVTIVAEP